MQLHLLTDLIIKIVINRFISPDRSYEDIGFNMISWILANFFNDNKANL